MHDSMQDDIFNASVNSPLIARELFCLMVGQFVGRGAFRAVYDLSLNPDLVIKYENGCKDFHNVIEWEFWKEMQSTPWAKWLAPCVTISNCGTLLVQRKVQPISADKLPTEVPWFVTDLKPDNWGILDGKPVCIDYGFTDTAIPPKAKQMKKAKWY